MTQQVFDDYMIFFTLFKLHNYIFFKKFHVVSVGCWSMNGVDFQKVIQLSYSRKFNWGHDATSCHHPCSTLWKCYDMIVTWVNLLDYLVALVYEWIDEILHMLLILFQFYYDFLVIILWFFTNFARSLFQPFFLNFIFYYIALTLHPNWIVTCVT